MNDSKSINGASPDGAATPGTAQTASTIGQGHTVPDPAQPSPGQPAQQGFIQSHLPDGWSERLYSPLLRCALIGLITMLLLIPLGLVSGVVEDRHELYYEATSNIAESWGRAQSISGPALIIPYQVWEDRKEIIKVKVGDKEEPQEKVTREYHRRFMVVLPSDLTFDVPLETEVRYRGIYRQALYTAPMQIGGSFTLPTPKDFRSNTTKIYWDQAWLSVGISDLKTIAEAHPTTWNGQQLAAYKPGANARDLLGPGFHCEVPLSEGDAGALRPFSMHLQIRGSGGISFTPVGEKTEINMQSKWPAPSFQGNLLPVERHISEKGFTAKWIISNLTRTYPQLADLDSSAFSGNHSGKSAITQFTAGLNLYEPVSLYRMVNRSVTYGILFIAVTFVALFAFEMVTRQRMHLLQYGMVGLSMSLFYLVLLSLSEHIGFTPAFGAAAAVTVLMNSLYVAAALRNSRRGLLMAALLGVLYVVLYSLLNLEDFALLMGTGLVVVMMGVLMFVTRNLPQRK